MAGTAIAGAHQIPAAGRPVEKVRREDNTVVDCALLIAYGITESGRRCVLGVSVELSEAEAHWRKFLESLIAGDFMD